MTKTTQTPAPNTSTKTFGTPYQAGRGRKHFVSRHFSPVRFDGALQYFNAHRDGLVSSSWMWDEGFRYEIEGGPGELTAEETQELLGQLSAALDAARAAGHRMAEGIVAELQGRRERIAPADLMIPARDVDGTLLDFEFPAYGPVATTWHPEVGFNYLIDEHLFLDPASARGLQGSLERVLHDNATAQARMDDFTTRWEAGEDMEGLIEWR